MADKEFFLHYVWKHRLLNPAEELLTDDGQRVEIIDPGHHNTDSGPDFFNAKIKIGDKIWGGNVEIHASSVEWERHGHHRDAAYNSVILHVVEKSAGETYHQNGEKVPQLQIRISDALKSQAAYLLGSDKTIPCGNRLHEIPESYFRIWMNTLGIERIERKTNDIFSHLERYNNSWDEVFYILLSRNFGFGLNSDAFERLALSLPFNCVLKHADRLDQIEALLFGQAGMLNDEKLTDDYYLHLKKEYEFLKHKFSLKSLDSYLFKSMRIRPGGFPQVRLAQLAALIQLSGRLFSAILEEEDYNKLRLLLHVNASEYWQTHYTFGKPSPKTSKYPGDSSLDVILINTVIPLLFAYGRKNGLEKYCDRAVRFLESLKPERNGIVIAFRNLGVKPENAFDTQALIQLKKEYCDKRKCLYCQIGHRLLKKSIDS